MTDERIVAYLLGELPEEESGRFEEECFAGENWPEQLSSVEEDLIDAYLRDELTPEQRQRFEQNYLTTGARRERVAAAAALLRHVDTSPVEADAFAPAPAPQAGRGLIDRLIAFWGGQSWGLRAGVAVAVMAAVACALWLSLPHAPAPRTFATLTLTVTADNNRAQGAQADKISLAPGTDALRVFLKLPEQSPPAPRYRAELLRDGGQVSSPAVAGLDAESVSVEIPAAQLTRGRYALRLFEVRPDGAERRTPGNYFFTVE